ncbi:MAG: ThiF family adenylyltransferase [Candidatus Saccharimonadales bacterium]
MQPEILNYSNLQDLQDKHPELIINDHINLALNELFDIANPDQKDKKTKSGFNSYSQQLTGGKPEIWGVWVYYPWLNQVVHFPPKKALRALRTSRNRNLIKPLEQIKLYEATLLIIGMSVGSNVVEALVSSGIGSKMVLVDMDTIDPSNLNRIRSPYYHVGLHKVEAISRKVWEIDPFIEIIGYREGLNEKNLVEILDKYHIDVVIDEMDELKMKIILHEAAKVHKLPVIMSADDGDNALLDIERYDLYPETVVFGDRIPDQVIERIKRGLLSRSEIGLVIGKYFVGPQNIPLRMYESLDEVGKTLPSWPQLGGAAALSGISLAYIVKKLILGEKIKSGRILISLDEKLNLENLNTSYQKQVQTFQAQMENQNL